MHISSLNPTKNPSLAGKHRRFASGTQTVRKFSSNTPTERAIVTLQDWLRGRVESGDVVSISLLARRAIAVYLDHVAALQRAGNIEMERKEVRKNSRMPNPNPRKRKPSTKKKRQNPPAAAQ